MLNTKITEIFGLTHPILSAGMAFAARARLAAAVSEAGGMGFLGADLTPPDGVAEMIRATRLRTERPFGVDFLTPFVTPDHLEVCLSEDVAVVVFFWGPPERAWVDKLQASGSRVWMQVGSAHEARGGAELGLDAIIVQGSEAGGHNRSVAALLSLLPEVAAAVAPLPVIAAGGIADGRGLAAALCLGAEAVWCGTRFLASEEANAHLEYKRRIVTAGGGDTIRTTLFGPEWPDQQVRVLRNRVVMDWVGREAEAKAAAARFGPIGTTTLRGQRVPMPKFSAILPTPDSEGDFEEMCLAMGESAGLVREVLPAAEIVRRMAREAEEILAKARPLHS